ncbi:MAG TPA: acetylglutamate kinase [Pseudonocardiaceae bacterium]|jgi:acetylglutamate kinase|nr:acetylglutamate kinase [Pseudonocardiaceae bacterium]
MTATLTTEPAAELAAKAGALVELLPWLHRMNGAVVVLKYGGHAMCDEALKRDFAADVAFLRFAGLRPVVVHGGGPQINAMLKRLGVPPSDFLGGMRVTTPEIIDVVRMVHVGSIGRELVGLINAYGPFAVGMSGEDGGLLTARRRDVFVDGVAMDVGLVGDVEAINPASVLDTLAAGRVPVIAPIAPDAAGVVHNLNADTAAAMLAAALGAGELLMLTDVPGLYTDWPRPDSLRHRISVAELTELLPRLSRGMAPKMEACLRAVEAGVPKATVIDGRVPHAVLHTFFPGHEFGTLVEKDEKD